MTHFRLFVKMIVVAQLGFHPLLHSFNFQVIHRKFKKPKNFQKC